MHVKKTIFIFLIILCPSLIFSQSDTGLVFDLDEEEYADDIPFNTSHVCAEHFLDKCIASKQAEFDLPEEKMANDIPFDTKHIASSLIRCRQICKMQLIKCLSIPLKRCRHELAQKQILKDLRGQHTIDFRSGSNISPFDGFIVQV